VPHRARRHPPLGAHEPGGLLRGDVEQVEGGDVLLGAQDHLLEQVSGMPPVHVEPGIKPAPRSRRGTGAAAHVRIHGHPAPGPTGADQEPRSDPEGAGQAGQRVRVGVAQVVLIARQGRLGDPDPVGQLGLGQAAGSARGLQDLAERAHPSRSPARGSSCPVSPGRPIYGGRGPVGHRARATMSAPPRAESIRCGCWAERLGGCDVERATAVRVGCGEASDWMRVPPAFPVDDRDTAVLRGWASDPARAALGRRAKIVLLCADGHGPSTVAAWVRCSKQTVIVWRDRYITRGLDGLRDAPRSGRPATVDPARVVLGTLQPPDPPGARWSTRSLGAELGISSVAVGNVWRDWGIRPEPGGRVSLRTEPVLDAVVLAVLGLHIAPPVYVFAILVADHPVPAPTAVEDAPVSRRGLGGLLDEMLDTVQTGSDDPGVVAGFLTRLRDAQNRFTITYPAPVGPATSVRTVMVAAGDTDAVRELLGGRGAVVLHTVGAVAMWARMVRVGCLLAGAEKGGAASVAALRTALSDHDRRGGPFTWG